MLLTLRFKTYLTENTQVVEIFSHTDINAYQDSLLNIDAYVLILS